jgi:hypothetical protein
MSLGSETDRFALVRFALVRFALLKFAPDRSASVRSATDRFAPARFASDRYAPGFISYPLTVVPELHADKANKTKTDDNFPNFSMRLR